MYSPLTPRRLPGARGERVLLGALLAIWAAMPAAAAQAPARGVEVFGSLGLASYDPNLSGFFSFNSTPNLANRTGVNFGGGAAIRPTRPGLGYTSGFGLEFEANLMRQRRQSTGSSPTPDDTATVAFYTASFVYHLLTGRQVQPYVLLGAGGVHDSGHGNSVAVTAGAGAKVFLTPRVSLRAEGRPFLSWDSFIRYSGGIGYHW